MIDVSKIEKIMELMTIHGFDVVQAESQGEKIGLARKVGQSAVFHTLSQTPSTTSFSPHVNASLEHSAASSSVSREKAYMSSELSSESSAVPAQKPSSSQIPGAVIITSPFVGSFYRAPGPDSPPFVEVGSRVKKGQSLCIVEAMKLMNEIECEVDGEVVEVLVENSKPVEFGTPLFVIAPVGQGGT